MFELFFFNTQQWPSHPYWGNHDFEKCQRRHHISQAAVISFLWGYGVLYCEIELLYPLSIRTSWYFALLRLCRRKCSKLTLDCAILTCWCITADKLLQIYTAFTLPPGNLLVLPSEHVSDKGLENVKTLSVGGVYLQIKHMLIFQKQHRGVQKQWNVLDSICSLKEDHYEGLCSVVVWYNTIFFLAQVTYLNYTTQKLGIHCIISVDWLHCFSQNAGFKAGRCDHLRITDNWPHITFSKLINCVRGSLRVMPNFML